MAGYIKLKNPEERPRAPLKERLKVRTPQGSRIPDESFLYGRLIPALLVGMGIVMVLLIALAVSVLLGLVG